MIIAIDLRERFVLYSSNPYLLDEKMFPFGPDHYSAYLEGAS